MGMGNYPCSAEVVEQSFVKEICGDLLDNLVEYLKNHNTDLESLADSISNYTDDIDALSDDENIEVNKLYDLVVNKFNEVTGLQLGMGYHSAEDRGDEVDGEFWSVDGVYQYSPAGEKYKKNIITKSWTVYG
jgi:hypothetical protein